MQNGFRVMQPSSYSGGSAGWQENVVIIYGEPKKVRIYGGAAPINGVIL